MGFDTIRVAREALGMAIAAERFGATYFSNGAQLGGILHANGLTQQARENLKNTLESRHSGAGNAHKWLLAPENSTFTEVGTNPKDSQLTELREHQVREIARFLRIPVVMIGDLSRATWGNYSEAKNQYFDSCIRTWCVNIEQHLTGKLVSPMERAQQFVEHVTEGFLRGDTDKRASFYGQMLDRGVFTINECRERENLPPIPGGDVPRVPLNYEPLAGEPVAEDDDVIEPQGRKAAVLAAHRDLLVEALGRMIRRQTSKVRKQDTSPTKLRHFAEHHYDDAFEIELCTNTLTPVLRVWLAFIGSTVNPSIASDALIRRHFAEQKRQMLALADRENDDLYAQAVEKTLMRWETSGPTDLADWLLQHGLTKDGTLAFAPPPLAAPTEGAKRSGMSIALLEKWHKTRLARCAK
jgi:hypothetical protein